MRKLAVVLVGLIMALFLFTAVASADVYVRGYFRKDGTYVRPHFRSDPDGIPFNNWSYPGNINPYTGKIATGNPDTYLKNYYLRTYRPSYAGRLGLVALPSEPFIKGVYQVGVDKGYMFYGPSAKTQVRKMVNRGDLVFVYAKKSGWYWAETGDGVKGYISKTICTSL